jgi:hypothetical protein
MAEITKIEVDLDHLRAAADRVLAAAGTIDEMRWPTLDADDLRGSAVSAVPAHVLLAARLNDVVANMRGWATAARMSADALEGAERRSADRIDTR